MRYSSTSKLVVFSIVSTGVVLTLAGWLQWGSWPTPKINNLPSNPDAIVVLGGGDEARSRETLRLAEQFRNATIVVTGDGGKIVDELTRGGLPLSRIVHERTATSTIENAKFTSNLLDSLGVRRAVLVTNWFHAPRALAVFRSFQPDRQWTAAFEPMPDSLDRWDQGCQRRERVAALHHLILHGTWCF